MKKLKTVYVRPDCEMDIWVNDEGGVVQALIRETVTREELEKYFPELLKEWEK